MTINEQQAEKILTDLAAQREDVKAIKHALIGDIRQPEKPTIVGRLRELELDKQHRDQRRRSFFAAQLSLFGGLCLLAVEFFYRRLFGGD